MWGHAQVKQSFSLPLSSIISFLRVTQSDNNSHPLSKIFPQISTPYLQNPLNDHANNIPNFTTRKLNCKVTQWVFKHYAFFQLLPHRVFISLSFKPCAIYNSLLDHPIKYCRGTKGSRLSSAYKKLGGPLGRAGNFTQGSCVHSIM